MGWTNGSRQDPALPLTRALAGLGLNDLGPAVHGALGQGLADLVGHLRGRDLGRGLAQQGQDGDACVTGKQGAPLV